MEVMVITGRVQKLWNLWGRRGMVLLSLLSQVILTLFGSRRKKSRSATVGIILWSAYMVADGLAKLSLSGMATVDGECDDISKETIVLQSFWAPFLILHLGGPDTITAYSLEDNDLWSRGSIGFFVNVALAIYILSKNWSNSPLSYLQIPLLLTGIVKYAERIWALRSKSIKYFRDSLLSGAESSSPPSSAGEEEDMSSPPSSAGEEGDIFFLDAYKLYKVFAYLFLNLFISPRRMRQSYDEIIGKKKKKLKEVYKLVETELGLMYDVLYTKADLVFSPAGITVRCISSFLLLATLVVFPVVVNLKQGYQAIDIVITYLLLIGAVILEVSSFIIIRSLHWPRLCWALPKKDSSVSFLAKPTSCPLSIDLTRWSRSVGQYNLIDLCIMKRHGRAGFEKLLYIPVKLVLLCIPEELEKYYDVEWGTIKDDFLDVVLEKVKKLMSLNSEGTSIEELLTRRGHHALSGRGMEVLDKLGWSILKADFDYSLLIWHIATSICYHIDAGMRRKRKGHANTNTRYQEASKLLSNYMLYLLVICPSFLPVGNGEKRYKDTCSQIYSILCSRNRDDHEFACDSLINIRLPLPPVEQEPDEINAQESALFYGCKLAQSLQDLFQSKVEGSFYQAKWEMISDVWLEIFTYAAFHSEWKEHTQHLRRGGELLTHLRLLMAHVGLIEQMSPTESNASSP